LSPESKKVKEKKGKLADCKRKEEKRPLYSSKKKGNEAMRKMGSGGTDLGSQLDEFLEGGPWTRQELYIAIRNGKRGRFVGKSEYGQ